MRTITKTELAAVSGGDAGSVTITGKKSTDGTAATAVSISKGSASVGAVGGGGARTLSGPAQVAACTDLSNQAVQACIDSSGCDFATSKEDKANIKANTYLACMTAINKQIGK